jgi:hypothetical protein
MNPFLPEKPESESEESLKQVVQEKVRDWLKHDFNFLVNALYRLDIPEAKFQAALALESEEAIVQRLTEEILRREQQKRESRAKYRHQNPRKDLPE